MIVVCAIYIVVLFDLQVVHGATWSNYAENNRLVGRTVEATRGRIMDRHEVDLVSNRAVNNIVLDWVTLHNSPVNTNDTLLEMVELARSMGYAHTDTLAISSSPLRYTRMSEAQAFHLDRYIRQYERGIRNMIREMRAEEEAEYGDALPPPTPLPEELCVESVTAVQLMAFMRRRYNIDAEYTAEEIRTIAGIRYEIDLRHIIGMAEYYFVEDAGVGLISAFLERNFPGVMVQESSVRRYNTTVAAHILGRVGPLTEEQVELFPDHPLDAHVGQDGLERDFEDFLHGQNGRMTRTVTAEGVVIGENVTIPSQPGGNVISTLDSGLQAVAEAALRSTIRQINAERGSLPIHQATGGSVVAIDPRNGEVLAIASTPSFTLENFSAQFERLRRDPGNPLLNRATGGAYEPGSAFKMVVALAGLYHGMITEHSQIFCNRVFRAYEDVGFAPTCLGRHGYVDLREALSVSCNIYFYQLADWLGLERMEEFAKRFGLGDLTGIGFGEVSGQRSTWDTLLALNQQFGYDTVFAGQVVQVGIGQGVSLFTPLQLANYTAMIASGGVRYRPTLLREARSYDGLEVLHLQEPEILLDMRDEAQMEIWMTAIQEGMRRASTYGTAARHLAGFRVPVASKTGTVEVRGGDVVGPYPHGVFLAYAPMDDPQIALAVVIEHGGAGSAVIPVATAMFEHFFQDHVVDQRVWLENVLLR